MKVIKIEGTTPISVNNKTDLMLEITSEDKDGNMQVLLIAKGDIICTECIPVRYYEIQNVTNEIIELSAIDGWPNSFTINHAWLIGKEIKLYQEFFK